MMRSGWVVLGLSLLCLALHSNLDAGGKFKHSFKSNCAGCSTPFPNCSGCSSPGCFAPACSGCAGTSCFAPSCGFSAGCSVPAYGCSGFVANCGSCAGGNCFSPSYQAASGCAAFSQGGYDSSLLAPSVGHLWGMGPALSQSVPPYYAPLAPAQAPIPGIPAAEDIAW